MIHQELSSIAQLTVAENLLLGQETARAGVIDRAAQQRRARALLARSAVPTSAPTRRRASLSVAQRQLVEIAKALRHEARVLIMDEPTAALTEAETERLFAVIRGLTARGRGGGVHLSPHAGDLRHRRPGDGDARRGDGGHPAGRGDHAWRR